MRAGNLLRVIAVPRYFDLRLDRRLFENILLHLLKVLVFEAFLNFRLVVALLARFDSFEQFVRKTLNLGLAAR